jgi:DNA-binding transcriptional ArsR family regulator
MPGKTSTAPSATAPSYAVIASALGDVTRLQILAALSAGGYRMVIELAELTGRKPGAISKHVTTLRRLGILVTNRGGHYAIAPACLPAPGEVVIGPCTLRFANPA